MPLRETSLTILTDQIRYKKWIPRLRRPLEAILKELKLKAGALNFLLTNDREIARLNRRFLHHQGPTDVMAFSLSPKVRKAEPLAGDVVVSLETIRRQSKTYGTGFFYELIYCLCHGLLHLKGYQDESPQEAERMGRKQTRLLKAIGLKPVRDIS